LPVAGSDELKQTNEIGMFIPVIDTLVDIADKTFTGDALLTQRKLAHYLVEDRLAHYLFIAKDILVPTLEEYEFYKNQFGSVFMDIEQKGKILWSAF
jgi:hypothetical protein